MADFSTPSWMIGAPKRSKATPVQMAHDDSQAFAPSLDALSQIGGYGVPVSARVPASSRALMTLSRQQGKVF